MHKKLKYILLALTLISVIFFTAFYLKTTVRESLHYDKHYVTIFTEEIGLGPNSHYESYIVPRYKALLAFIECYDHIKMIDSDSKLIAIKDNQLKLFIPPNRVIIHHNGKSYEIEENTITHLKDFSGFEDVVIYHGKSFDDSQFIYENDKIKEQFVIDTKKFRVRKFG